MTATVAAIPIVPLSNTTLQTAPGNFHFIPTYDPNATLGAFNYTYTQANLYTANSTSTPPLITPPTTITSGNISGAKLVWLNTVTRTKDNTAIQGSGFRFNLTRPGMTAGKWNVTWTLFIPQFNCQGCSGVSTNFNFFGATTKGANASYTLLNGTKTIDSKEFPFPFSLTCPETVCVDVTPYIGRNVTLTFGFSWNATEASMHMDIGEIAVASIGTPFQASSNFMQQDPTNSSQIIHMTNLSRIAYNNTLRTTRHPGGNLTQLWWNMEIISIYYPAGYRIKQAFLNSTLIYPSAPKVPLETDNCNSGSANCAASLLALNVTDFTPIVSRNSTITIASVTLNAISVAPISAGVVTNSFAPGDTIGVKAPIKLSVVNATVGQRTGTLNINFFDHTGTHRTLNGQTTPTQTSSGGVFNFTLPTDCSNNSCGTWTITANFTNTFDLGASATSFQVDLIQVTAGSFIVSGDNRGLNIQGSLTNSSGLPVPTASGVVFAVDQGTPTSLPITATNTNSSYGAGLYVSNITLVNAVFTQGQSLIMFFTIVNPSTQAYNATVRIEHMWPGVPPSAHGAFANVTLGLGDILGDLPFISGPQSYQATFTLTANGMRLTLTNVKNGNSQPIPVSLGTSPVSPTESHAGLFKVTVVTKSGSSTVSTNPFTSPTFAYVVGLPSAPSRFLTSSTTFTGTTFSSKITSDAIVGAQKLVVFALARDSNGRILTNNSLNPGFVDSTILQASMDNVGQVAKGQTATATLHLTSNATKITQIITINLNIQNVQGPVATQSNVTIGPGATQSVALSFTAPSTPGQYTLSFSSPQYNGNVALASQTLQVTIAQSNLQILIPAAIGVVAGIIVLSVYLLKREPGTESEGETKTRPSDQKTKPAPKNPPSKSLTRTALP